MIQSAAAIPQTLSAAKSRRSRAVSSGPASARPRKKTPGRPRARARMCTAETIAEITRSAPRVDPPVLVPGEDDALHVVARLVVGDLLDEGLDVVTVPRAPPLAQPLRSRVVRGERQARVAELAQESGEGGRG